MSYKTEANKKIESTNRDPITDAASAKQIGPGIGAVLGKSGAKLIWFDPDESYLFRSTIGHSSQLTLRRTKRRRHPLARSLSRDTHLERVGTE